MWVVLVLSVFVISQCGATNCDFEALDRIKQEDACNGQGGICTFAADCPKGQVLVRGLCPIQQRHGVECCNGLPNSRKMCRERGGTCLSRQVYCPPDLVDDKATDCDREEYCCVNVNK